MDRIAAEGQEFRRLKMEGGPDDNEDRVIRDLQE
jgi:hypothetical protein